MNDMTRQPIEAAQVPAVVLPNPAFSLVPKNLDEALRFSKLLSQSELVPKDYVGKEANCFVAMQWGMELGLPPLQAMQNIAVINGRPSLWGDAVIALVRSSPLCEWIEEEVTDTQATCTTKRRGAPKAASRTFSMADAEKAGLKGKSGPWTNYPKRMLQMRARAWLLRDVYPDVLRGMPVAEEVMDTPAERDVTAQGSHTTEPPKAAAEKEKPAYDAEAFAKNLPTWRKHIDAGRKTPADVIATVESKYALTAEQKQAIEGKAPEKEPLASAEDVKALIEEAEKLAITQEEIARHLGDDTLKPGFAGMTVGQLARAVSFLANPGGQQ